MKTVNVVLNMQKENFLFLFLSVKNIKKDCCITKTSFIKISLFIEFCKKDLEILALLIRKDV